MTSLNLNGKLWSNSDSIGKQLIQKLGWAEGEGLGKNKQGSVSHVKVSLKNDRDGIGMKSEKFSNNCGLLQTFDYDMLLKSKYASLKGNNVEESIPRSMSRAKFGRAVRQDYYTPLNNDDWTKILGKSVDETIIQEVKEEKIIVAENNIVKVEPEISMETKFVTKKMNVNEYFEMQMKLKMAKLKCPQNESLEETKFESCDKRSCSSNDTESEGPVKKKSRTEKSIDATKKVKKNKNISKNDSSESENKEVKTRKSKNKGKKVETDTLSQSLTKSEIMLNGIADLLTNEPIEKEKKKSRKSASPKHELKVESIVELVSVKMIEMEPIVKTVVSPLDKCNIKDIKGYKYY